MAYRTKHEELVVTTKTHDLILWSCNHTGKFPRNHRFVLDERIESAYCLEVTPPRQVVRRMTPSLPRLPGKVRLVFCRPDLEARTALRAPYAKSRFSFSNNALRLISQPVNRVQTTSRVWARGPMIVNIRRRCGQNSAA